MFNVKCMFIVEQYVRLFKPIVLNFTTGVMDLKKL